MGVWKLNWTRYSENKSRAQLSITRTQYGTAGVEVVLTR